MQTHVAARLCVGISFLKISELVVEKILNFSKNRKNSKALQKIPKRRKN